MFNSSLDETYKITLALQVSEFAIANASAAYRIQCNGTEVAQNLFALWCVEESLNIS